MSPLARLPLAGAVLARLALGRRLRVAGDLGDALLGIRQVAPRRGELQRLALAVAAPVAAIARGAERGQLDDGVHGLEQLAVMADDDRARPPAGEQLDHRLAALAVEIVGRLVEQEEVGLGEDERGEPGPRALPAGQRRQRRVGPRVEPDAAERGGDARLQRPVGVGQLFGGGLAGLGAAQERPARRVAPNRSATVSSGST